MTSPTGSRSLRGALLTLIAVGLVVLGGGLAVVLGLGQDDTSTPSADSVDAGFSRDMSRHHLQGVEMANLAPDRSQDQEVRQLAFDISATQTNQVGRMQGWLTLWGLPISGGEVMAWMSGGHGGGHGGHLASTSAGMAGMDTGSGPPMPGMATEEELANLRSLSGRDFDVEFLRLMIRHHQGGREMADYATTHADVPAVRDLARTIAEAQAAETRTMAQMLSARGGTPLPAP